MFSQEKVRHIQHARGFRTAIAALGVESAPGFLSLRSN